jgi:hypothetical protein
MVKASHPAPRKATGLRFRDALPTVLAAGTLLLVALQFALAGFGAFTADKTSAGDPYAAHMVAGKP